jgi:hypothetical protein
MDFKTNLYLFTLLIFLIWMNLLFLNSLVSFAATLATVKLKSRHNGASEFICAVKKYDRIKSFENLICFHDKGQLISKANFEVFI